jgi:hypothetical protein
MKDQQLPEVASLDAQRAKTTGLAQKAAMIVHREWISLGVMALEAAERAHEANDPLTENYYLTLARKCDACADQVWLATKGSAAPG